MKYIVEEIQTFEDGNVSTPAYSYNEYADSESKFHDLVSKAVKSALPTHAIVWMTNEGRMIDHKSYSHGTPEPQEELTEE